jgi:hypothetical protein
MDIRFSFVLDTDVPTGPEYYGSYINGYLTGNLNYLRVKIIGEFIQFGKSLKQTNTFSQLY